MSHAEKVAHDVNAALEAALDEFDEEDEEEPEAAQSSPPPMAGPSPPPTSETDLMEQMMQELFSGQGEANKDGMPPELAMMGQFLQHIQTQMAQEMQQQNQQEQKQGENPDPRKKTQASSPKQSMPSTSTSKTSPTMSTSATSSTTSTKSPLDETIANLVESMAQHQLSGNDNPIDDTVNNELPPNADAFFDNLMAGNPDALLQGMMEELMKKDIMAEPIQQVAAAFPDWLRQHEKDLTPQEYEK
jgi:hypothetical protein